MEGVFSKCQDCGVKPATIKFTNNNIEKKVCYNCQKKLEADPTQRNWKKEIIPYAELRKDTKLDQTRSPDFSRNESFFKSPEPAHQRLSTSSILKPTHEERLSESSSKYVPRLQYSTNKRLSVTGNENVSPKVSFAPPENVEKNTRSFSVSALSNELLQSSTKANTLNSNQSLNQSAQLAHIGGAIRHGTPKKKIFFSEYLKDFDPTISSHKSPFRSSIKDQRELIGRASVDESKNRIVPPTENNSFREFEVKNDNYGSSKNEVFERHTEKVDSFRTKANPTQTPDKRDSFKSTLGNTNTQEEINKKLKELRKEEIRSKINKLTEKLYSPSKIKDGQAPREDFINNFESPRGLKKDTSFGVRDTATDNSYLLTKPEENEERIPRNNSEFLNVSNISRIDHHRNESQLLNNSTNISRVENPRNDLLSTSNVSRLMDQQNIDLKYKIIIQEHENTIFNLKNHISSIEKRQAEVISKLKDDIRDERETYFKEKEEINSRNSKEIKSLNDRIRDLERNWKDEVNKNRNQQDYDDQQIEQLEKRIAELRQELDNTRQERDSKINDLNNQLRNLQKSQREALSKVRAENEQVVAKAQEENAILLKDTTTQLEKRTNEIERLKKEKSELIQYNNDKLAIFQDKIKNLQELNDKLNQTIDLKNEEIKKLNRKVNEAKTEFTIIRNEVDLFDQEKERLKDENERLKTKLAKLEKLVYGYLSLFLLIG